MPGPIGDDVWRARTNECALPEGKVIMSVLQQSAPPAAMQVVITLMIKDPSLKRRCEAILSPAAVQRRLGQLCGSSHSYQVDEDVNYENRPEHASELLRQLFLAPDRSVIVVSDLMAEPRGDAGDEDVPIVGQWWRDILAAVADPQLFPPAVSDTRLGSLAITDWAPGAWPTSTASSGRSSARRRSSMCACAGRSGRWSIATRPSRASGRRPSRSSSARSATTPNWARYYRLRHRIYSIMGYLDHEVELLEVGMEFDWCDLFSVPIGAFVEDGGVPTLIGCSRLITTYVAEMDVVKATWGFARESKVLEGRLRQPYRFQLPFLQSIVDNDLIVELYSETGNAFSELSRVIVGPSYGAWDCRGCSSGTR